MAAARESREGAGPGEPKGNSPGQEWVTDIAPISRNRSDTAPPRRAQAHSPYATPRTGNDRSRRVPRPHTFGGLKIPYFKDDVGRTDFCNRVARGATKFGWRCKAFALLTTTITSCWKSRETGFKRDEWLNGTNAQRFNKARTWGHLAEARYSIDRDWIATAASAGHFDTSH